MGKTDKRKSEKDIKRCIYSQKIISNKDVVITDYIFEYIKKMGYYVYDPQLEKFI